MSRERDVILVRHGRTAMNADGRLRGHHDPPLDDHGRREAVALATVLGPIRPAIVLSSPLLRAVQTAGAIAASANAPVQLDRRLIDRDYGPWTGEPADAVVAEWGSLGAAPGVEAESVVIDRVRAVLDECVGRINASMPRRLGTGVDGPAVVVTHDAVNRLLLCSLDPELGDPEQLGQRTACWNVLHYANGEWQVERVDEKPSG